jgi:glycosyltransferase involved in cell wall biosynthesis
MGTKPCTIFIPLLNEEEIIAENANRVLTFMEERNIPCELILGSNGSSDSTPHIIESLASCYPNVRAFHMDAKAPGLAFSRAVQMASYEYVVSQDADLAVELGFIPMAISLLDHAEMVVGCKRMRKQDRAFMRRLGSNFFIFVAAIILDIGAADFSIGAKAYRRSFVMENIKRIDAGTAYVLELVYWAGVQGRRVIEVSVECSDNRKSRFNLLHETCHKFGHLFRFARQERALERSRSNVSSSSQNYSVRR